LDTVHGKIKAIDLLKIEYAPKPKENYLNDLTSFDAYIEYTSSDDKNVLLELKLNILNVNINLNQVQRKKVK
jgi:hypothetical protein